MAKKSPLQREYARQRKRIHSFLRRAEKRGFEFNKNVLPDIPKKITSASVRRLQALTPEALYKKAKSGVDITTGEIISPQEARKIARSEAAKKAAQTRAYRLKAPVQEPTNTLGFTAPENIQEDSSFYNRTVLSNWYLQVERFQNSTTRGLLRAWMNTVIRDNGEDAAVEMLQRGADEGLLITRQMMYSDAETDAYINKMTSLIPDQGVLYNEQMMDRVSYMKSLGEALEQDEAWERPF